MSTPYLDEHFRQCEEQGRVDHERDELAKLKAKVAMADGYAQALRCWFNGGPPVVNERKWLSNYDSLDNPKETR